jgi:hypothetical protein
LSADGRQDRFERLADELGGHLLEFGPGDDLPEALDGWLARDRAVDDAEVLGGKTSARRSRAGPRAIWLATHAASAVRTRKGIAMRPR